MPEPVSSAWETPGRPQANTFRDDDEPRGKGNLVAEISNFKAEGLGLGA